MKRYILTGGIACGKSTVAKTLKEQGIKVIDADVISHTIFDLHKDHIKEMFGTDLDGTELRGFIANEIFSNPKKRFELEFFMHPLIRKEMNNIEASMQGDNYILDIPLYYEKTQKDVNDVVIVISTDYETQLDRLMKRNNLSLDDANKRILTQIPNSIKESRADYVIKNDGTINDLVASTLCMIEFYF